MPNEPLKFTNIPSRVGEGFEMVQPLAPEQKTDVFESGGSFSITDITPRESSLTPPGERPGEEDLAKMPDYSNRDKFEKSVIETLGANPFQINPNEVVTQMTTDLEPLFNHVFKNKVNWRDRDRLTPEQAKWWDQVVKSYRAQLYDAAKAKKENLLEQYKYMMGEFDARAKEQDAERKRIIEERKLKVQEAAQKTREERVTALEEKEAKREAAAARKEARLAEPKTDEVKKALDFQNKLVEDLGLESGEKLPASALRQINDVRKSAGLPELVEKETTETKPTYWGLGAGKEVKVYKYEPEEETPQEMEAVTTEQSQEEINRLRAAEPQIKEKYPEAKLIRLPDGTITWAIRKSDGKVVRLRI